MIDAVSSKLFLGPRPSLATMLNGRMLVQIGTYNANLQGNKGLPQNLVDWLVPSLDVSNFLANNRTAPDIVAIGFQELLPLPLGSEYESCFQVGRATTSNVFSASGPMFEARRTPSLYGRALIRVPHSRVLTTPRLAWPLGGTSRVGMNPPVLHQSITAYSQPSIFPTNSLLP